MNDRPTRRAAASAAALAWCLLGGSGGAAAATVTYSPDVRDFANPERGFYVQEAYDPSRGWTAPLPADWLRAARARGISVVRMYYVLGAHRNEPIPAAVLARVDRDLATVRSVGAKMIPRFAYNFGPVGAADAPRGRILAHLDQLRPVLRANADVIAFMEAGFIGTWGEWHTSTNRLDSDADRRAVLSKVLQILPSDRMAAVRTPAYKRGIFGTDAPLTAATGYGGSDRARTGAHNDCFLASVDDYGTYSGTTRAAIEEEKSYLHRDNLYVPQGGETCSNDAEAKPFTGCANALKELARMRWSVINEGYNDDVLARWRSGGCMGKIERRLGYRLALRSAEVPGAARAGGPLRLRLKVRNEGWANPYNPRPVEVVLRPRSGGPTVTLATGSDARRWANPGTTAEVALEATLPGSVRPGAYEVLLGLPDPEPRLRDRPEYAVRLANEGVWRPALGLNDLRAEVVVSPR